MTIVEALKAGKIDRITLKVRKRTRWLYFADGPQYGIEQNHWVVRESRRGGRYGSPVLIMTEDEAEAVEALIGEVSDEQAKD